MFPVAYVIFNLIILSLDYDICRFKSSTIFDYFMIALYDSGGVESAALLWEQH